MKSSVCNNASPGMPRSAALMHTACFVQLLHAQGKPNIFTSHTDDYWRLVRKGVAPAFSPKNIRYTSLP